MKAEEAEARMTEWGKESVQRRKRSGRELCRSRRGTKDSQDMKTDAELNGKQEVKEWWNNPPTAFLTVRPSRFFPFRRPTDGDRNKPARCP